MVSLVANGGRSAARTAPRFAFRMYRRANRGNATTPPSGCATSNPRTTHTCPYTNPLPAGPGVGLWCTPAPCTWEPYRAVGVSSNASTTRGPVTNGRSTSTNNRVAMASARRPTAAAVG
ncbi:hypothetical protein GobsT_29850 [Gemmata obscuriglobus]|nr:hypothetical protein GobsT_27290 [Gemmata obscuriglobus]VTS05448.1 unnamed protein product [Gemmata obscuriglobus UQM 2246]QEG28173.1 hypothetical protein GobsT_29470 [Gemmata obscuriglobus]QEG28209.1 hypothetical protein GobsT_29850 [Gemmata obscuriglobus]VTS05882.1 unnamed protein product [Gemmata obscuriglobus UQM 2246]